MEFFAMAGRPQQPPGTAKQRNSLQVPGRNAPMARELVETEPMDPLPDPLAPEPHRDAFPAPSFPTPSVRDARIGNASGQQFDVLVIGGGIAGASVARDAALRGYSVLLLERNDYAWGASSRSSKFLHGGLRYLEQGDIGLVAEALHEREVFCRIAPHLNHAERSIFVTERGRGRPAWQVRLGLGAYDFLAKLGRRGAAAAADFLPAAPVEPDDPVRAAFARLGRTLDRAFYYSDGKMDDSRLVVETVLDAELRGAVTLNYCPVEKIGRASRQAPWAVHWRDSLTGTAHQSTARFLVLAAGPEAATLLHDVAPPPPLRFSRGVHLLFDVDLQLPPLTIPRREPGRIYFIHPLRTRTTTVTWVGTTDHDEPQAGDNPFPPDSDIEELLTLTAGELPKGGLHRENLFRAICGMRVLVPRGAANSSARLRRRELLQFGDRFCAVHGGKYTTARHVAERVCDRIDLAFGKRRNRGEGTGEAPLPGAVGWAESERLRLVSLLAEALAANAEAGPAPHHELAASTVQRFGSRAACVAQLLGETLSTGDWLALTAAQRLLAAEARYSSLYEQAVCSEDLCHRRLALWAEPDLGELQFEKICGMIAVGSRPQSAPSSRVF